MQQESENSVSDKNQSGQDSLATTARSGRDRWDFFEILARPVSAFITALAVASIGIFGNMALTNSNQSAKERAEIEQNTRLYTELLSRREQADSNLRKDMFTTILTRFLIEKQAAPDDAIKSISDRLLKLELLALNFGEALSLRPLFQEMNRSIESHSKNIKQKQGENPAEVFRTLFKPRLESLARRVSDQQISALSAGGAMFTVSTHPGNIGSSENDTEYQWLYSEASAKWKEEFSNKDPNEIGINKGDWINNEVKLQGNTFEVNGITRTYNIALSDINLNNSEVTVNLSIVDISDPNTSPPPVVMTFKLNYFNFPMIDNTRLSGDQRFALVLTKFNSEEISIVGICFPGMYASQRDKPFLDDVINQLQREQETIEDTSKGP